MNSILARADQILGRCGQVQDIDLLRASFHFNSGIFYQKYLGQRRFTLLMCVAGQEIIPQQCNHFWKVYNMIVIARGRLMPSWPITILHHCWQCNKGNTNAVQNAYETVMLQHSSMHILLCFCWKEKPRGSIAINMKWQTDNVCTVLHMYGYW